MFSVNNFRLRLVDLDDSSFMLSVRDDLMSVRNLGTFIITNESQQKKWIGSLSGNGTVAYFIFEKYEEDSDEWVSIGYARLTEIDRINLSVCVGADIHPDFRGQGYSKKLYYMLFTVCFEYWNMNRVWLLVVEYNEVALNLYRKLGFQQEGRMRQAIYRNFDYHDYILMGLLRHEYIKSNDTFI